MGIVSDDTQAYSDDLPPSRQEASDRVSWIRAEIKRSRDDKGRADWLKEAELCWAFVAGDQWSAEDKAILRDGGRPEITFNRIAPLVDAVAGAQVNNRQETKFLPRTMDDGGKAELLQGVVQWVRDQCDAEDEESEAFVDAAITGLGWTETRLDYSDDPDGRIEIVRGDPREFFWTPEAHRKNLIDARWRARVRKWPEEEVYAIWPEARSMSLPGASVVGNGQMGTGGINPTRDGYAGGDESGVDHDADGIEVICFEWAELETEIIAIDPGSRQTVRLSAEQWQRLGERLGEDLKSIRHTPRAKRVWYRSFVAGDTELQFGPAPVNDTAFKCITYKRAHKDGRFYGLVRMALDPQRWANKWLSQSLHILNTGAKSGIEVEQSAIPDTASVRAIEENYAKPGSLTVWADGALSGGRVRQKTPMPMPQGMQQLLQFAIQSIPDVTGINKELMGTADRDQPGILEWQRKQAGQTVMAPLFDALRRYYKEQGRYLLQMIHAYLPPDKVVRVTQADGNAVPFVLADLPDIASYDVVVDQAPTSPNQKIEVWSFLQPTLPALIKLGLPMPVWAELLRYSPLPESAVEKIVEGLQQMAQQPPPPDPQMMRAQADMAMKQQDMQFAQQQHAMDMQGLQAKNAATVTSAQAQIAVAEARMRQAAMAPDQRPN